MVKHQKGYLGIFLDNSCGLSNSAVEVVEYKNLIPSHGFLRLKEVSAQGDLARSSFTCSLKAQTLSFCWSCQSSLYWGRNDGQICCNLLLLPHPIL